MPVPSRQTRQYRPPPRDRPHAKARAHRLEESPLPEAIQRGSRKCWKRRAPTKVRRTRGRKPGGARANDTDNAPRPARKTPRHTTQPVSVCLCDVCATVARSAPSGGSRQSVVVARWRSCSADVCEAKGWGGEGRAGAGTADGDPTRPDGGGASQRMSQRQPSSPLPPPAPTVRFLPTPCEHCGHAVYASKRCAIS